MRKTDEAARKAALLEGMRHALGPQGRQAALETIARRGPRYGTDPDDRLMIVRISPDGTRVRVADCVFVPEARE